MLTRATLADFETVKNLFLTAKAESCEYDVFKIDHDKAALALRKALSDPKCYLFLYGDRAMVMFHSEVPWFSGELGIREDIIYVRPEDRGGLVAVELLDKMLEVARELGAKWLIAGSSMHPKNIQAVERLYNYKGFKSVGLIFSKDLTCC